MSFADWKGVKMNELGLVLVGFVCGVIFGVFMAAIIAASSDERRDNKYGCSNRPIEKIGDSGIMYVDEDIQIIDKLDDGRYLLKVTRRK